MQKVLSEEECQPMTYNPFLQHCLHHLLTSHGEVKGFQQDKSCNRVLRSTGQTAKWVSKIMQWKCVFGQVTWITAQFWVDCGLVFFFFHFQTKWIYDHTYVLRYVLNEWTKQQSFSSTNNFVLGWHVLHQGWSWVLSLPKLEIGTPSLILPALLITSNN